MGISKKSDPFGNINETAEDEEPMLSLADRLRLSLQEDKESKVKLQESYGKATVKLEENHDKVTRKLQESYGKVTVKPEESQGKAEVKLEESRSKVGVKPELKIDAVELTKKEGDIYHWFWNKGAEGFFSPKQIMEEMKTSRPTVLKAVKRFQELKYMKVSKYSRRTKSAKYELDLNKKTGLEIFEQSKVTVKLQESQSKVEVKLEENQGKALIYKKDRQNFLNNLSISEFWTQHGLTPQRLKTWQSEFEFTDEEWEIQFQFGEHEPKVIKASNPINYFYKTLKAGGLTRPDGYETPEERRARIAKESAAAKRKALEEFKKAQAEERALADEQAILEFLADKEQVAAAIADIKTTDKVIGSKLKIGIKQFEKSGRIITQLENRLKRWMRSE